MEALPSTMVVIASTTWLSWVSTEASAVGHVNNQLCVNVHCPIRQLILTSPGGASATKSARACWFDRDMLGGGDVVIELHTCE